MASFIIQAELEKTEFNLSLSYENELLRDFERTTSYLFQKILNSIQTFFVLHNIHLTDAKSLPVCARFACKQVRSKEEKIRRGK